MSLLHQIRMLSVLVLMLLLCVDRSEQQGQSSKCMDDFSAILVKCVTDNRITIEQFLWFVTNGTSPKSQAPPNPEAFQTQICGVQQQIGACTFQQMGPVMNSSACVGTSASTSQQAAVGNQLTSIFSTYDIKCMHPCRMSLPNDLRTCYSDNKLDPNLFMSNSTNGAIIGSTKEQTAAYCAAKDTLTKCLQSKADACPEAPTILRAMNLDIPSLQKGVEILCKQQDVYLKGLGCFTESTPEIERCQQKVSQSLIQLDSQARAGNWSEEKFYQEFCPIQLSQIQCDQDAWSKKNHPSCSPDVIGLRTQMECQLRPSQCNFEAQKITSTDHACHPSKFGGTSAGIGGDNTAGSSIGSGASSTAGHVVVVLMGLKLAVSRLV